MSAGGLDVLVVGEINPDIIVADPDLAPIYGQVERIGESIRVTVGSSSAIVACGLATLGMDVAMFGVVGEDPFGRFMLEELKARGVDVTSVVIDAALQTGATVILAHGPDRNADCDGRSRRDGHRCPAVKRAGSRPTRLRTGIQPSNGTATLARCFA